jgi:hypothetical protein
MYYLAWFDDSPKTPPAAKVQAAAAAYLRRFGTAPNVALVSEGELCEAPGLAVRAAGNVRRFNFWIGREATT